MTIELFGFPGTRSNRVQWLLEELELPYEFHKLALFEGEHKRPAHLERHPHGSVPAMSDGDLRLIESAAMILHLVDKAGKLAPPVGTEQRARFYQFVIYAPATLDEHAIQFFFHTVLFPEARREPEKAERAKPHIVTGLDYLTRELGDRAYLVDGEFSAADITLGYTLDLIAKAGLLEGRPTMQAYFERLAARPAFQKVFA